MCAYYQADPDEFDPASAQQYDPINTLPESQQLTAANLDRWFDLDREHAPQVPKDSARVRRRPLPGSDYVKHRRTRSGCYTCRARRVKCDEQHPICERCRKGSRECVYPEPPSATKTSSGSRLGHRKKEEHDSGSSSADYDDDEDDMGNESPIFEKGPQKHEVASANGPGPRKNSKFTVRNSHSANLSREQAKEKSLSPSTDDSAISKSGSSSLTFRKPGNLSTVSTNTSVDNPPWSHLRSDIQYYLEYHQTAITNHHYFFKYDSRDFIHTSLVDCALSYEPLLYALVGFSAFQASLRRSNGKISDFLGYYNKSVSLLRQSLKAGQKHQDATLLTILQLAAFEEYLGDWVNLIGHQKAAYEMLRELYTPATLVETDLRRKMFTWYARFDLFAGIMSGTDTVIDREWASSFADYFTHLLEKDPKNIDLMIEQRLGTNRLLAMDMASLFAKLQRGVVSIRDFFVENQSLSDKIKAWRKSLEPLLAEEEHRINSFEDWPPPDPGDIVDPYQPGLYYSGPLYQTAMILQQQAPEEELATMALEQLRYFEAIDMYPGSPSGAVLNAQACLGLATLFLPKDEKHIMWCRRKLAKMEGMGYIYPTSLRTRMATLWSIPSLTSWWLPNNEGLRPIIAQIRSFVSERTVAATNESSQDVRDMKGIFSKLSIGDDSPKDSPESTDSVSSGGGGGIDVARAYESVAVGEEAMSSMSQHQAIIPGAGLGSGLDAIYDEDMLGEVGGWDTEAQAQAHAMGMGTGTGAGAGPHHQPSH